MIKPFSVRSGIDPASLPASSTSQAGIVQLTNSTSSTSTSTAATPSSVKSAYDLASAAIPASQKGANSGVATLDSSGKVPNAQLPSASSSARVSVATAAISSGTLTLNAASAAFFEVTLNADVTNLVLSGAESGLVTEITVNFRQDATGNRVVKLPSNVYPAVGDSHVVASSAHDRTIGKFTTYDGGTTWSYVALHTYAPAGGFVLPTFDENAVYNNEGTSTSGWTNTGFTFSQPSGSVVRFTNPSNSAWANVIASVPGLSTSRDTLFYGRIRAKKGGGVCNIFLRPSSGNGFVVIRLNHNSVDNVIEAGAISFESQSPSGTDSKQQLLSRQAGFDTEWFDFCVHIDVNFGSAALYIRHPGPTAWGFAARVPYTSLNLQELVILSVPTEANFWVEFDFLTVCKPNLMSIGDSICAGTPLYEPILSANRINYIGSWQPHCRIYPNMRNNFIVNKGISGENSTAIDSRITNYITNHQPRLTFLHASTNDPWQLSHSLRTSNIQSSINKIVAAGGQCVLLAAMLGTQETVVNTPFTTYHDYFKKWEKDSLPGITNLLGYVDIAQAVRSKFTDYTSMDLADDPVHPNIKGHRAIGGLITSVARVA